MEYFACDGDNSFGASLFSLSREYHTYRYPVRYLPYSVCLLTLFLARSSVEPVEECRARPPKISARNKPASQSQMRAQDANHGQQQQQQQQRPGACLSILLYSSKVDYGFSKWQWCSWSANGVSQLRSRRGWVWQSLCVGREWNGIAGWVHLLYLLLPVSTVLSV